MADPDGGVYTYSYDEAGQLIELVDPRGQATYQDYDLGGRLVRRQAGNGAVTSFVYDCADRLKQLQNHRSDGTPVNIFTYTYDHAGNRTGVLELSGDLTTWTYDASYQLVHEQRSGTHEFNVTYTYDPAGNRTLQDDAGERTTYTYDAANQLLTEQSSAGLTTYVYDESGNRIEKNAPAETTYYTWDEDSRLVAAEPPAGVTTLVYNADGLRVGKETPSESRKFIYDFRKLLQETDGADDPQRWYTFTTEEYGDLISQYDGADTLFHQYDGLGSTDALLDEWETATDRYAHRAFGLEAARSGTTDNPFTYVGRQSYYKDPELELYLLGARYYDPALGRFLSQTRCREGRQNSGRNSATRSSTSRGSKAHDPTLAQDADRDAPKSSPVAARG
jgi:RHS repeat-associated protein